jgi:hypothetical protein
MTMMFLLAAMTLLPALIAAAIQTRDGWQTEKVDRGLFIEIDPLF